MLDWSFILLAQGLFALVLSLPAGILVDRVGNRKIIIITLVFSLFYGFLFVFYSKTFIQTIAVMLYVTTITSFLVPASMAMLADIVPRSLRARVTSAYGPGTIGVQNGSGGGGAGYILAIPTLIGNTIGGVIYGLNPVYPWILQTFILAGCLFLSIVFLKEPEIKEI